VSLKSSPNPRRKGGSGWVRVYYGLGESCDKGGNTTERGFLVQQKKRSQEEGSSDNPGERAKKDI